ncbi:MAG: hydroxyethylthiazole kinase [Deltaproteobacteria bacterium SG8_13]|nr:MAG: hydroxyethylthiazole kinase [Deltaproteobacteria bacterium SG8_13]
MNNLGEAAARNLAAVREKKPLIHNITNFVVMNTTANALLAMGASPVMAHAPNEVEEMVSFAGALVLNIGTLTDPWVASMLKAGAKATALNKPVILDPVGSGATALRTDAARTIIAQTRISVIRGNASEVLSLQRDDTKTKGVDSIHTVDDAAGAATALSSQLDTTLAITGPVDLVTDGKRIIRVANGHPLMGYVTGTGCTATVAIGAFLAVDPDPVSAAATALAYFGLAGEIAGKVADAPGSFWVQLLDALYTITPQQLEADSKIESG